MNDMKAKPCSPVFRNFLRNPEKYLVADKKKQEKQQFTDKQRKLLILFQNMSVNDMGILRPGEKVASHEGVWTLSSPEINGGAPMPITDEMLAELEQRLADVCRKAVVNMDGHVVIPMACLPTPLIWKADEKDGKPVVYTGDKKLVGAWESIYGALLSGISTLVIPVWRRHTRSSPRHQLYQEGSALPGRAYRGRSSPAICRTRWSHLDREHRSQAVG
ncbi:hypothetical protein [Paludibacterium denitrificans]|uniref:Uncharacterized protein n=1 Tax=Paludibacterium denitrificans TaxID=2675226 RepID=A0A844GET8_9NEIS|nr:hypothetical protein [Paludibacterium denitrificans]MTD34179.1 hypothetical protein [Paludibacterium denitrificans]